MASDQNGFSNEVQMIEAAGLFSRATIRALDLLSSISNFRKTIEVTVPLGESTLQNQALVVIEKALADPSLLKVFKDPGALSDPAERKELAAGAAQRAIDLAGELSSAASLVFAHAVFDATLFDFCRVAWLWAPQDWIEIVNERRLRVREVVQLSKPRLIRAASEPFLMQLERESVLKKAGHTAPDYQTRRSRTVQRSLSVLAR